MATTIDGTTGVTVPGTGSVILTGATSGTITLTPTAVAGTTTLTMPATTGTVALTSEAVRQVVSTITGAVATGTTALPWDDTIPQNTEGDQYMTLAVTPKSATSKLEITVVGNFACSASEIISMALFQDSTANALQAVAAHDVSANLQNQLVIEYVMTSGTTSATTFKVRAGPNTSGTITFNGSSSGRKFGGVMASSIIITEIGT